MNYEQIEKIIENTLSPKRYQHSVGVAKRAVELAKIYGEDEKTAQIIGITHDIAKEIPTNQALQYIKDNGIKLDEIEQKEPGLWHCKIGADMATKQLGFTKDMAQAIVYHTTGSTHMNTMDKIIYLADKTEENRTYIDLEQAKRLSDQNLDEGVLYVAKVAIEYSLKKNSLIHPDTIYLINQLIEKKRNNI